MTLNNLAIKTFKRIAYIGYLEYKSTYFDMARTISRNLYLPELKRVTQIIFLAVKIIREKQCPVTMNSARINRIY